MQKKSDLALSPQVAVSRDKKSTGGVSFLSSSDPELNCY